MEETSNKLLEYINEAWEEISKKEATKEDGKLFQAIIDWISFVNLSFVSFKDTLELINPEYIKKLVDEEVSKRLEKDKPMDYDEQIRKYDQLISDQKNQIAILTDSIDDFENRIKNLQEDAMIDYNDIITLKNSVEELQLNNDNHNNPQMSSSRTFPNQIKLVPPRRFKGTKAEKPLEFLKELKEYINCIDPNQCQIKYIISQTLEAEARDWYHITETSITNWDDFEAKFKSRFWNDTIKRGIIKRLDTGFYRSGNGLNRVQYATQLISLAKDLEGYNEERIIKNLYNHFGRALKYSLMGQPPMSTDKFIELLSEFDLEDSRNNNNSNNNNSSNSSGNNSNNNNSNTNNNNRSFNNRSSDNKNHENNEKQNFKKNFNPRFNNNNNNSTDKNTRNFNRRDSNYNNNNSNNNNPNIQTIQAEIHAQDLDKISPAPEN